MVWHIGECGKKILAVNRTLPNRPASVGMETVASGSYTHVHSHIPKKGRRGHPGDRERVNRLHHQKKNPHNREHGDPREIGDKEQPPPRGEGEIVPKAQGQIWKATADGSCLFYCVAHSNSCAAAMKLRMALAHHDLHSWNNKVPGLEHTVGELLTLLGWGQEQYLQSVLKGDHWADEIELILLSRITQQRLRVFYETEEFWQQYVEYGTQGLILRLRFIPPCRAHQPHYDVLLVKEAQEWQRPQTLVRAGGEKGRAASRLPVKDLLVDRVTSKAAQKSLVQQVKRQRRRRLLLVKEIRETGEVDEELIEDIALLTSLANDNCTVEQMHVMARALAHMRPWNVLGVQVLHRRKNAEQHIGQSAFCCTQTNATIPKHGRHLRNWVMPMHGQRIKWPGKGSKQKSAIEKSLVCGSRDGCRMGAASRNCKPEKQCSGKKDYYGRPWFGLT